MRKNCVNQDTSDPTQQGCVPALQHNSYLYEDVKSQIPLVPFCTGAVTGTHGVLLAVTFLRFLTSRNGRL